MIKKRYLLFILITAITLILVFFSSQLYYRHNEKKLLEGISFSVRITQQSNSNQYGKGYPTECCILQEIVVNSQYEVSQLIFSVNANQQPNKFVNAEALDGTDVDFPSNSFSAYNGNQEIIYTNRYYYKSEREKNDILKDVIRDYKFKFKKDSMDFFGPYYEMTQTIDKNSIFVQLCEN